jgi:peroxiredoxin
LHNELEKQKFGQPLADFSLRRINGETVSLSQSLEEKKGAVVLFWSGVCSHCARYDASLNAFEKRHPDLVFLALASRHGETVDAVRKVVNERKLTFPILHDPGGRIAKEWFTQQTPRAFLMDGRRALLYRGAIDNYKYPDDPEYIPYLEPAVNQFLSGKPVERPETASYGCAIQSVYYVLPKAL